MIKSRSFNLKNENCDLVPKCNNSEKSQFYHTVEIIARDYHFSIQTPHINTKIQESIN